jgi:hypothetical protein
VSWRWLDAARVLREVEAGKVELWFAWLTLQFTGCKGCWEGWRLAK